MNFLIPFANTGDKEVFDEETSPDGDLSLEKGFTTLFELKPEEGGLFILRKKFNQLMNLITSNVISWRKQTFPDWIADAGSGIPYAYGVGAVVKYTDGFNYQSLKDNNTDLPTVQASWGVVGGINTTTINATSDADITLTSLQNQYGRFVITDIGVLLTTTRNVIVGTAQKRFLVQNNTAQSLVFKTSGGSGITVLAGEKADLYCDGTNVIDSFFTYKNPAFSAFLGADLILSAATFTKVPFVDTYGYDAIGNFDNTNYRFQPNKAGIYHVSGGLRFNTTDITQIIVYKNGVGYRYLHYGTSTANLFNGNSIDVYLNGTSDYIELYARSNNANTVSNSGGQVGESSATFFQAHFAGAL